MGSLRRCGTIAIGYDSSDFTDYFQRTFENTLILRRVLRPRRICDIYDLFAPFINLLTYLLTQYRDCSAAVAVAVGATC